MSSKYGLVKYFFNVLGLGGTIGKTLTEDLRITVLTAGTPEEATIYADAIKTSMTNPITNTVFEAMDNGLVEFWYGGPKVDVLIRDDNDNSITVHNVTPSTNHISFDQKPDAIMGLPNKIIFEEDFLGVWSTIAGPWAVVDVGDATEAGVDIVNGGFALEVAATSEAEDAVLYFGDCLSFDIDDLEFMEFRAAVVTPGTGVTVVAGMAGAHNLDKDTVAQCAWFRMDASLALDVESDDGTNNNDDKTTGLTPTTLIYYDFAIDFRNTADVRFFVDGVRVSPSVTFDMSNYTAGLQPYFSLDKASGTATAKLTIDRLRIVANRT